MICNDTTLTTGQVAALCNVAPRTVSKWVDGGRLKGFRLPGSQDRRVYRDDLRAFFKSNGMRDPLGPPNPPAIALMGSSPSAREFVARLESAGFDVLPVATAFEAGHLAAKRGASAVVVDLSLGRLLAAEVGAGVRATLADGVAIAGASIAGVDGTGLGLDLVAADPLELAGALARQVGLEGGRR